MADVLERHGYSPVITPPFERAEVIARGLPGESRELLRFVDPATSEVAVFRPDITVQVARVASTALADYPPPLRLYYEGHVVRTRRGRARGQRQIAQLGAECIGIAGLSGDEEVVALASAVLDAVDLVHVIELCSVPLVRTLTSGLPPDRRTAVMDGLARKDRAAVSDALRGSQLPKRAHQALVELEALAGDPSVLREARRLLGGADDRSLDALEGLCRALRRRGLGPRLRVDLGEVRGFDYYTGPSFFLLAEGPGEPLGAGGRYDELLGRFGMPRPATGFAIDVDHTVRALGARDESVDTHEVRLVLSPTRPTLAAKLRRLGAQVAGFDGPLENALDFARAWGFDAVLSPRQSTLTVRWTDGRIEERITFADLDSWIARASLSRTTPRDGRSPGDGALEETALPSTKRRLDEPYPRQ